MEQEEGWKNMYYKGGEAVGKKDEGMLRKELVVIKVGL